MNENALISAEAIVTSKRSDHVSMFDADFDVESVDPKQFYADPALVKTAVLRFKKAGFSVASVDRFGMHITGTKILFETTFGVTLIPSSTVTNGQQTDRPPYVVAGNPPTNLINPQQSAYNDLLDGLALSSQPHRLMEDPSDDHEEVTPIVRPTDLPKLLNGWSNAQQIDRYRSNTPVEILVIDSGCDRQHLLFRNIKKKIEVFDTDQLNRAKKFFESSEKPSHKEIAKKLLQDEPGSHGTFVTGFLTPLLTPLAQPKIWVAKTYDASDHGLTKPQFGFWFPADISKNLRIINLSAGQRLAPNSIFQSDKNYDYSPLVIGILDAIKKGTVVIYSSGNIDEQQPDLVILECQIPGVISVGGVYRDSKKKLVASNAAHGYPKGYRGAKTRAVPHICALTSPHNQLIMQVPFAHSQNYKFSGGTSLAAPQISGVCALIISVCPAITPAQVKELLMRTATQLPKESGKTAQGYLLKAIKHTLPNGDVVSPGFVNIKRAVRAAKYLNFMLMGPIRANLLVNESVKRVKKLFGNDW